MSEPKIVIEGMEDRIKLDLDKHKVLLERAKIELISYRQSRSHEIKKKKHYKSLIGGGKYNDEALERSIKDIRTNIRHMSHKCKLTQDRIDHLTLIVDTLSNNLENQLNSIKGLHEFRRKQDADSV